MEKEARDDRIVAALESIAKDLKALKEAMLEEDDRMVKGIYIRGDIGCHKEE